MVGVGGSEDASPVEDVVLFKHVRLPLEVLVAILSSLTARELGAVLCSCKVVGLDPKAKMLVSRVVERSATSNYGKANKGLRLMDMSWPRDMVTFQFAEMRHVVALCAAPEARPGKGYFVSKNWISNHRRYVESLARRRGGGGAKNRRREREESNLMPPWPDINVDITCPHGALALVGQGQVRARRRTMEKSVWRSLATFYPQAKPLPVHQGECFECRSQLMLSKAMVDSEEKEIREARASEISTPTLKALYGRKLGVPSALIRDGNVEESTQDTYVSPVLPGIYHLMPRCWLNAWRSYVRDPKVPPPRVLASSLLLCEGHGKLIVPPHVEEYLSGERDRLLGSLDPSRSGCVCELLTPEEWEAITLWYPCDFAVRLHVSPDDGSVAWGVQQCHECDPCFIGQLYMPKGRKLSR
jgi:hypothetical protein